MNMKQGCAIFGNLSVMFSNLTTVYSIFWTYFVLIVLINSYKVCKRERIDATSGGILV